LNLNVFDAGEKGMRAERLTAFAESCQCADVMT
jgi:hypothetical protein